MKTKLFLLVIFIMPALCWNCKPKEVRAPIIPLEDFFKNPEKAAYQISPDGKHFSYLASVNARMNVFIQEVGTDTARQITFETDRDIAWYFWASNTRILYQKDIGGNENFRLFGVNLDGSDLVCFTPFEGVRTQVIDDLPDIDDEVIIQMNKRNPEVFDPYRLNILTGEMKMLAENPGNIVGWMTDHAGKLRVAFAITDGVNTTLLYRNTEDEKFQPVLTTTYKDNFSPHFFTFNNKYLYASSDLGRDKQEIIIFDPVSASEIDTLYKNDEVDVTGLSYSRKRKVLTEAIYVTDKRQHYFFDDETKAFYERLAKDLGQYEIAIGASSKEEDVFIIRTYSDRTRGAYYLYSKTNDTLQKIHDISPWLKEDNMAVMKPVQYASRDSLTIHGYLTLPVGIKPANLPVVIHPHGGPWARDFWGFNPEVQFLANRGYAVLQMNFRGSTGYGKNFVNISYKQWGRTMQDDITDGVKWLIEQGIADTNKIAIYGGSYGGYATLAGLTITPDLYACGVDYVGVANMFTFMNTIPPYWEPMRQMFYEMVGDPVKDSLLLAEVSPVFLVDNIKAPLFVAQGANDPRVNKNESDQMVEALKKRGITVEYMVKDNEGHGFRNEENRFDFYRAMERFLATHIGDSTLKK
ncbi:MAG: S9 family peptidase [Bacteroidales bacterium]|nr:S9 family peptidase [Bacteroidales bacterium]